MLKDKNRRPYAPEEYSAHILKTMPYNQDMYEQAISIIRNYGNCSGKLLDVGCGTGIFEELLRISFSDMKISAIDPAEDMLKEAISRRVDEVHYSKGTILDVYEPEAYDAITAIMSHHLVKPDMRVTVIERVFETLKKDGIYIAFENIVPEDDFYKEKELNRWAEYQINAGKSVEEAEIHKARCGTFYFPLTVEKHKELLKNAGFSHIYVFWRSYMQMGIMGIK